MSQDDVILLLFKVVTIAGFLSLIAWIVDYTRLARWWANPIGRSLVIKASLVAALMVPTALSLFFRFNRLTSHVAAWIDIALIGAVTPVMLWRVVVFRRTARKGARVPSDNGDGG